MLVRVCRRVADSPIIQTFILIGTMIILNLFNGVVMEGFARARNQVAAERQALAAPVVDERNELEGELERIHEQLTALTRDMHRVMSAAQRARANGGSTASSAVPGGRRYAVTDSLADTIVS